MIVHTEFLFRPGYGLSRAGGLVECTNSSGGTRCRSGRFWYCFCPKADGPEPLTGDYENEVPGGARASGFGMMSSGCGLSPLERLLTSGLPLLPLCPGAKCRSRQACTMF